MIQACPVAIGITNSSVSIWQKYQSLPKTGRLWIGITTLVVAYGGGKVVDQMYDEALIREEAERRLKLQQQQQQQHQEHQQNDRDN